MNQNNSTPPEKPEKIEKVYRRHILNLLVPISWSVMVLLPFIVVIIFVYRLGYTSEPLVLMGLWLFGGVYIIFVLSLMMMQWIIWYLDIWVLTSNHLIDTQLVSLFNRKIAHIPLNQIQDVQVGVKGYLPAIFRFGDVTVQSAGKEGSFKLSSISNPKEAARKIRKLCEAYQHQNLGEAAQKIIRPTQSLGNILVSQNKLSHSDLTAALNQQQRDGRQLGKILLEKNLITREDLVSALGSQYHIPSLDLSRYEIDPKIIKRMSYDTAVRYTVIPISQSPEALTVAIAHPSPETIGELAAQMDVPLAFMVADEDYIKEAIRGYYQGANKPVSSSDDDSPTTLEDLGLE
ncbi:hypothetical protein DRH29_01270 [candidate division Kazan bacterium]|uniref:Type II secretion system protein GspE N-terminal domain-containing protein n=1 Tax=candidate division Kazan bacterium TaxID=2202143 RepID=A0A420ZDR4_UNCK3|nr:MAG: hypothetical protein DRH29_01270 [candidate division Kazan bacterium]